MSLPSSYVEAPTPMWQYLETGLIGGNESYGTGGLMRKERGQSLSFCLQVCRKGPVNTY